MAGSVNRVILVGRLGKDPEVKYTQNGLAIGSASLATDNPGRNGEKGTTEWHRLVLFDKQAESLAKFKRKGDSIYVEGRIQTREWDDKKSGEKRYVTEIVVSQVTFMGGRNDGGDGDHSEERGQRSQQGQGARTNTGGGGRQQANSNTQQGTWQSDYENGPAASYPDDDDIPF